MSYYTLKRRSLDKKLAKIKPLVLNLIFSIKIQILKFLVCFLKHAFFKIFFVEFFFKYFFKIYPLLYYNCIRLIKSLIMNNYDKFTCIY